MGDEGGNGRPPRKNEFLVEGNAGYPGVIVWLWYDDMAGGEYALSYDLDDSGMLIRLTPTEHERIVLLLGRFSQPGQRGSS